MWNVSMTAGETGSPLQSPAKRLSFGTCARIGLSMISWTSSTSRSRLSKRSTRKAMPRPSMIPTSAPTIRFRIVRGEDGLVGGIRRLHELGVARLKRPEQLELSLLALELLALCPVAVRGRVPPAARG